jgi:hypothetical protein
MVDQLFISGNEESEYDLSSIGLLDYSLIFSNEGVHLLSENFSIDLTPFRDNIRNSIQSILRKIDDDKYCFVDEEGVESILINSYQLELIINIIEEENKWELEPL